MPDKEGAQEKSTTKEVVNKKQKQMMGEEGYDVARDEGRVKPSKDKKDATSYPVSDEVRKTQKKNEGPSALEIVKKKYGKAVMDVEKKKNVSEEGKSLLSTPGLDKLKKVKDFKSNADRVFGRKSPDLTKVAESFGGEIIGEPVELDEGPSIVTKIAQAAQYFKKPAARRTLKQFIDIGKKYKDKVKTFFDKKRLNKIFNKSKDFENIGGPDYYSRIPKPPIKEPFKPLKPLKDFIRTGTEKAKTQFSKIKDALRPKKKTKNRYDTYVDDLLKGNKGKNMGKNKSKIGTTTKVAGGTGLGLGVGTLIGNQTKKKGAGGKFRPRLPQTSHNIGRTSNPQ